MITKKINDVVLEDIQALVDNAVPESKTIEYKQELLLNTDQDKKEFLADVSSFANANGGDLIIGIVENREDGTPEKVEGIVIANTDAEIRKLENIIRDGISPRIPSVNIKEIKVSDTKIVLLIRIQKSWISPHRIVYKGWDKFYSRNSKGKYL